MMSNELNKLMQQLENMSLNNDQPDDENRVCYLDDKKEETRKIGEKIYKLGGFDAMLYVGNNIRLKYSLDRRELDLAWDGIGEWRG